MSRHVTLEGIRNFRDFGGYRGHAGRMARGRFFRSAHYAHASDEDLDHLAGMGIGAVVDLRRPEERTRMPSRRWTDFNAELIENHDDDEGAGKESWHGFMEDWDLSTEGLSAIARSKKLKRLRWLEYSDPDESCQRVVVRGR